MGSDGVLLTLDRCQHVGVGCHPVPRLEFVVMSRRFSIAVSTGLVLAGCLSLAACSGSSTDGGPSPTPRVSQLTLPSSSPTSPAPSASASYDPALVAEAEQVYRDFDTLVGRIETSGGQVTTAQLSVYSSADLLREMEEAARYSRENHVHTDKAARLTVLRPARPKGGLNGALIVLDSCRDSRGIRVYQNGAQVDQSTQVVRNTTYLRRENGKLKAYHNEVDETGRGCPA